MRSKKKSAKAAKKFYKPSESRRGFIRVEPDPGTRVIVDGGASYEALDLSVYGMSFLVPHADLKKFVLGAGVPSLSITIQDRKIEVSGKVAYLQPVPATGPAKVAVEFTHVDIEDVWYLSQHVAEKADVHKPSQIGAGMIEVGDLLLFPDTERKSRAKPKKRKKKAPAKAKEKKAPVKSKAKARSKKAPKKASKKTKRK